MRPAGDHVSVLGSKRSAFRLAVLATLFCEEPPSARTLPVGRSTAFIWMRGADIGGSARQAAAGCERSMISALSVAGLSPPMIMIRAR